MHLGKGIRLLLLVVAGCAPRPAAAAAPPSEQQFPFHRAVANVEYSYMELQREPPIVVKRAPPPAADLWYGLIIRRFPGESARVVAHFVPLAVEYAGGVALRARCDSNFNGDLSDDPAVSLTDVPKRPGVRSFLTDLRWDAPLGATQIPIEWRVRVILEPEKSPEAKPLYRVQRVYAMVGTVEVAGKPHQAFLFDGNGDGLYTKEFFDGLFVDLDDDRTFQVDMMSREFIPFVAPFPLGTRLCEVTSLDREGRELTLRDRGAAAVSEPPEIGKNAPDFSYRDASGREIRLADYRGHPVLVYFWASWCGNCADQAAPLKSVYDRFHQRGVEILGISYDTDRAAMEAFRSKNGQAWPTSFSGRMYWEDPIGKLYQVRWPSTVYLVDGEGRLDGIYRDDEMDRLGARLAALTPPRARG